MTKVTQMQIEKEKKKARKEKKEKKRNKKVEKKKKKGEDVEVDDSKNNSSSIDEEETAINIEQQVVVNPDVSEVSVADDVDKEKIEKEKKKRKRKGEDADDVDGNDSSVKDEDDEKEAKSNLDDAEEVEVEEEEDERRVVRHAKRDAKKQQKKELLKKVPNVDENGISYTKLQIRRMLRRVKSGLPPVLTEAEERERVRQIRLEKKEEENELSGMLYERDDKSNSDDDDDDGDNEEAGINDTDVVSDNEMDDDDNNEGEETNPIKIKKEEVSQKRMQPLTKKKKRSKEVPSDYVCQACNNTIKPAHWIYDCPNKINQPGTNNVSRKKRGLNEPSDKKVFVSGLPFEIKSKQLGDYFTEEQHCGTIFHVKLLTFEDSKRCKGQAFITFESETGAQKALQLDGNMVDWTLIEDETAQKKKKKKGGDDTQKQKQLKLSVNKVRARTTTQR